MARIWLTSMARTCVVYTVRACVVSVCYTPFDSLPIHAVALCGSTTDLELATHPASSKIPTKALVWARAFHSQGPMINTSSVS